LEAAGVGVQRSADLQSAVAQDCILQRVGEIGCAGICRRSADCKSAIRQTASLRYDRGHARLTNTAGPAASLNRMKLDGATREQMLQAALKKFAESDYTAISVQDIVEAAAATEPTLDYFP
jgi:hypothetical protein